MQLWSEKCLICNACSTEVCNIISFKQKCLRSEAVINEQLKGNQELEEITSRLSNGKLEIEFITFNSDIAESNNNEIKCEETTTNLQLVQETKENRTLCVKIEPEARTKKRKSNSRRVRLCIYCGKSFKTSEIHRHTKIHLNKRESVCDLCGKGYNSDTTLRLHKICVHSDPETWKHICDYCGKRFPFKGGLQLHVRRHTGEKRFFCDICARGFCDKVMLQTHCISHTNQRTFECKECGNCYKYANCLKTHQKRVHNTGDSLVKQMYLCHLCSKQLNSKHSLERHLEKHKEENDICEGNVMNMSYKNKVS